MWLQTYMKTYRCRHVIWWGTKHVYVQEQGMNAHGSHYREFDCWHDISRRKQNILAILSQFTSFKRQKTKWKKMKLDFCTQASKIWRVNAKNKKSNMIIWVQCPRPTWWKQKADSGKLFSDLHTCTMEQTSMCPPQYSHYMSK